MTKKCSECISSRIVEGFGCGGTISVMYCYHREVVIKDHHDKVSYPVIAERARSANGRCGPGGKLFCQEVPAAASPVVQEGLPSTGALKTPWTSRKARPAAKRPPPYKAR